MSVSIKLSRFGSKGSPFYKIVAQTTRSKRDGKSLDVLGWWNPEKDEKELDKKKLDEWVKKGAIVTEAVKNIVEGKKKVNKKKKKAKSVEEEKKEE